MAKYRPDGSIQSHALPVWENRAQRLDHGLYKAIVMEVVYTDSTENTTQDSEAPEVLYDVMIIGGPRDGQRFKNVRDASSLGGVNNYSERIWKKTIVLTRQDPASLFSLESLNKLNGDVVYVQFLNGDTDYPIILGGAKHTQSAHSGATETEGIRKVDKFNGIKTEITKDGEYSWIKDNGLFNTLTGEFLATQEAAVSVTLDNLFKLQVAYSTGMSHTMDGTADSFAWATKAGLNFSLDGISDKLSLGTKTGASLELDGVGDSFNFTTKAGSKLVVSGSDGIEAKDSTGAGIKVARGKIAIGTSNAEIMDILSKLLDQLSKEAPSGFGAPLSGVPLYAQLKALIDAAKGSL